MLNSVTANVSDAWAAAGKRYEKACYAASDWVLDHSSIAMLVVGVALLSLGMTNLAHAQHGNPGDACGNLLQFIEGGFGALVAAATGIGAIIASAVGGFKTAWCLLGVSVGAFILRSYITLFNTHCQQGGASGGAIQ